jgi:hypothetical protein
MIRDQKQLLTRSDGGTRTPQDTSEIIQSFSGLGKNTQVMDGKHAKEAG